MYNLQETTRTMVAATILAGLCANPENNIPSALVGDAVKLADSLLDRLAATSAESLYPSTPEMSK